MLVWPNSWMVFFHGKCQSKMDENNRGSPYDSGKPPMIHSFEPKAGALLESELSFPWAVTIPKSSNWGMKSHKFMEQCPVFIMVYHRFIMVYHGLS